MKSGNVDVKTVDECLDVLEHSVQSDMWKQLPDQEKTRLARIMHHAERFCMFGRRSRAGDPSVWIGVRSLAVQHVWD